MAKLARLAAPKSKAELDAGNRRADPEQLADEIDAGNQRGPRTVTATYDQATRESKEQGIQQAIIE